MAEEKRETRQTADAPAEPIPAEETISNPGTTLGAPTDPDCGITNPGTTLGLPLAE